MKKMLSGPERNWSLANHTRDQLFSENNTQMRRIGKPTCMKLYKFNGTNPPPDSAVGFKHFRNTSTYNNWVFGEPLYHLASHLYIELYHIVSLDRLHWNLFLKQWNFYNLVLQLITKLKLLYNNVCRSYIDWKSSSLTLITNCPIAIGKARWDIWAIVNAQSMKNVDPISIIDNYS